MARPPTCGAAAAVLASEAFARRHGLDTQVTIRTQAMVTDRPVGFEARDMMEVVGADMTRRASASVYEAAGVDSGDIPVIELHECFAHNEVVTYEGLGCAARARRPASSLTATTPTAVPL